MTPDRILKRYFPALTLLLIACVAYLQARGAVRLLALALGGPFERVSVLPPKHDTNPPAPTAPKSGQAIIERNPFDSTARGVACRGALANPVDASDPLSWPACPDVQVVIVSESRDPLWSLATLHSTGEPRSRSRRVGDSIANKQVAFIGYNPKQQAPAVWLQGQGTLCQTLLFRPPPAPAPVEAPVTAPTLVPSERTPLALLRSVRVVPEQKDGKLVGLRLFGIKPSSLLNTLGLRNGDRLESVNGFDVANPAKALEAYARLSTATRFHVRLERSGKPLELDLNIL
jgi:general secretion pathway protein C